MIETILIELNLIQIIILTDTFNLNFVENIPDFKSNRYLTSSQPIKHPILTN